ncbi:hypothetical protein Pcinc_006467 [Petrolisthes cinctipes]|uniref:Uncharacterized protein n=1 Tax=Petrolisthes cinctipes TaxID=88211 RepID=A0AAE1L1I2_PETCI|nr:hypothetical protein Pcinc_006467 [Petrolisthes cinctipes]
MGEKAIPATSSADTAGVGRGCQDAAPLPSQCLERRHIPPLWTQVSPVHRESPTRTGVTALCEALSDIEIHSTVETLRDAGGASEKVQPCLGCTTSEFPGRSP